MTERPEDPDHAQESPLTPAEDERIRGLLAEARHDEPMPHRLVQRFDRVLAGLATESAAGAEPLAPVVDLASRRRRTAAKLLVAAAAVIVAGVGVTQVLPSGRSQDTATTAESAQDTGADANQDSAAGSSRSGDSAPAPEVQTTVPDSAPGRVSPVHVRAAHFGADVRRARSGLGAAGDPPALSGDFSAPACPTADFGDGLVVGATYDGAPAALVLRQPAGDVQVVDLYLCGTTEPTRSITLTYP